MRASLNDLLSVHWCMFRIMLIPWQMLVGASERSSFGLDGDKHFRLD